MTRLPGKLLITVAVLSGMTIFAAFTMAGNTGQVKGVITDKASGEPIPGASVQLDGTTLGDMTDLDGKFLIKMVPPGEYVLRISSVSYSTVEVQKVLI
ncbi:MAG: carboxypeptidase-like regulatory domain-containing protein, partial [Candidatus Zixiibacteriota bacterium]